MSRIILFGATGYTGELTARALVDRGSAPLLVARNQDRVDKLAADLGGLETAVADVSDPGTVRAVVEPGDVLISTVGPFLKWGQPAVTAAAEIGAHYFDSTGEWPFIRKVFELWGPVAQASGVGLLPAFGFDYVPGSLAAGLALERSEGAATAVEVGYFVSKMNTSGGTRATAASTLLEPGYGFHDGRLQPERPAQRSTRFEVNGQILSAVSLPAAEQFALPQVHPELRSVEVYLGVPGEVLASGARLFGSLVLPALEIPPLRRAFGAATDRFNTGSTGGPDAESRAQTSCTVVARARSADGDVTSRVTLNGPDPYQFTADILAWGAMTAAEDGLEQAGGVGPLAAFGLDRLKAGAESAGLIEER